LSKAISPDAKVAVRSATRAPFQADAPTPSHQSGTHTPHPLLPTPPEVQVPLRGSANQGSCNGGTCRRQSRARAQRRAFRGVPYHECSKEDDASAQRRRHATFTMNAGPSAPPAHLVSCTPTRKRLKDICGVAYDTAPLSKYSCTRFK